MTEEYILEDKNFSETNEFVPDDAIENSENVTPPSKQFNGAKHEGFEDYDHVEIVLEKPIHLKFKSKSGFVRDEIIFTLIMRECDARDLEDVDIRNLRRLGSLYPLIATLCNVPVQAIRKLKMADMAKVGYELINFIPDGLLTGQMR